MTPERLLELTKKVLRIPLRLPNYLRLKNKNFTIIAKDCTGGLVLHELFQRFDTPTINACFNAGDYVKFCKNMKFYLSQELVECTLPNITFPVGTLGEAENKIMIHFVHYDSFIHAKQKWEERSKRIHWDNLFFFMTDGEGCDYEIARDFDLLPHEHKVLLTYRDLPDIKSAVKLNTAKLLYEQGLDVPFIFAFKSKLSMKRVIDDWDYVGFLNS